MDPLTVSAVAAVLNKVLGATAAEAGKSAWAGLVRLVRSTAPEHGAVAEAAEQLTPGTALDRAAKPDQNAVIDLSAELVNLARSDAGFADVLREWLGRVSSVTVDQSVTLNVVGPGANVHGIVIQARTIDSIGPMSDGG